LSPDGSVGSKSQKSRQPSEEFAMDASWVLVILSTIVLVAYLFDFVGRRIRVPAVVMLIFAGLALRFATDTSGVTIASRPLLLPLLGTIGLILIVLEGALDLSLSRDRIRLIARTFLCATIGIVLSCTLIVGVLHFFFHAPLLTAILNAIPFAVISSAVAIPAAAALSPRLREFVVYESSFSDIVGVVIFYAALENVGGFLDTTMALSGQLILSAAIGVLAAAAIFWLIQRIDHHVRVLPMIFGVTLLYGLGKALHLAPLVMVLIVGLLLNNPALLGRLSFGYLRESPSFAGDLDSFKHLTAEFAFVVRTYFFVLLGFGTQVVDLLGGQAWLMALAILACCILPRIPLIRWVAREKIRPLVWFAPRGLITVLLYLSVPAEHAIAGFPHAAVMLVILLWAVVLSYGVITHSSEPTDVVGAANTQSTQ
jgi:potassium/hydrogen antiporter